MHNEYRLLDKKYSYSYKLQLVDGEYMGHRTKRILRVGKKDIKPIDIQKVVQNMSGWLCKTKRLRGFNLQLHLGAF